MKISVKKQWPWLAGGCILLVVAGYVSFPAWQPLYLDYNDNARFEALKNDGRQLRDRLQAATRGADWNYHSGCARSPKDTIICSVISGTKIPVSTAKQVKDVINAQRAAFSDQLGFELTTTEGIVYPDLSQGIKKMTPDGGATFLHSGTGIDQCRLTYAISQDQKRNPYINAWFSCSAEARKFYYPDVMSQVTLA